MNNDTKRLFLAMFLTFGFLFVWSKYFSPQPIVAPTETTSTTTPTTTSTPVAGQTAATATSTPTTPSTSAPAAQNVKVESFEAQTKDQNFKFTNASGGLASVQLKNYKTELTKDAKEVSIIPLAMDAPSPLLWNISFRSSTTGEPKATLDDQKTSYAWNQKTPETVSFVTNAMPSVQVQKIYRTTNEPYIIEQVIHIENQTSEPLYVDANTSIFSTDVPKEEKSGFLSFLQAPPNNIQAVTYARDEAFHWKLNKLPDAKSQIKDSTISWAGFSSQYFLLTALPKEGIWNSLESNFKNDVASLTMGYPQRILSANSSIEYVVRLYAGPKQIETLQATNPTLDRSVDLGSWIGGLARGIHKLLGWIYGFIPNYGWAIVILTVLVRIAVFPLAQMQARSMKRMTTHKPAMDALKEKHGKDREAHSRELMAYMRTHKINPASGCLPLLIQFPVFIALYRVLYNSVELRHAPFGFWIHDLSAHDPFFVLPVLVGITFYIQTKLNPTPMADPAQQTMMKIMPIMFSVFMIFLPSGLNLYIFVSTLWGIVQQYMVQKSLT